VLILQFGERLLNLSPGSIRLELALPVPREVCSPVALLVLLCPHDLRLSALSALSLCTEQSRRLALVRTQNGCRRALLLLERSFVLLLHRTSPLCAVCLKVALKLVELLAERSSLGVRLRLAPRRARRVGQGRLQQHATLLCQLPPPVLLPMLVPHACTQHLNLARRRLECAPRPAAHVIGNQAKHVVEVGDQSHGARLLPRRVARTEPLVRTHSERMESIRVSLLLGLIAGRGIAAAGGTDAATACGGTFGSCIAAEV
jgi:hypothetical protein